jgi:hypothetical protein
MDTEIDQGAHASAHGSKDKHPNGNVATAVW